MARREIHGKRILLTGATSGLGLALCESLQHYSVKLFISGRNQQKLREIAIEAQRHEMQCAILAGDLTDPEFRSRLVQNCIKQFGGLDILINNAGVGAMGRFETAQVERLRQVFEINFFAAAELTRAAIPHLKLGSDPAVVNIGSVLGHRAVPLKSEYCASKFALHGFSDALRSELSLDGIDVLHVCPGTIDTPFFDSALEDSARKNWKAGGSMAPAYVAKKLIVALQKRKPELILPWSARMLVALDRLAPRLANYLVTRFGQ